MASTDDGMVALTALLAESRQFTLPDLEENKTGWGPSENAGSFTDIPYAPFNKADKLGRVSDWISNRFYQNNRNRVFGAGTGGFGFAQEFEEGQFNVVDNTPRFKPRDGRRRYAKFSIHNKRRRGRGAFSHHRGGGRGRGGASRGRQNNWNNRRWGNYQPERKEPSIQIQDSWSLCSTLDLSNLQGISMPTPVGRDLVTAGTIECYRKNPYDRITPRNAVSLHRFENTEFITASTSEDPILRRLQEEKKGTVYGTDTLFAVLMTASRSVNPWDIRCTKRDGVITFEKRPGSDIDYLTVNENWNEIQETDVKSLNHPKNLFKEATLINHNFSQQVLDSKQPKIDLDEPNPFAGMVNENCRPASVGYRYRSWRLSEDITLVGRCEVNGYTKIDGEKKYLTIRALNDFDHTLSGGIDWKNKLELAPAQVLASEMKNNNCKLAKWASKVALAGTDELRLGFVTRSSTSGGELNHQILLVRSFRPQTFVGQLQMRVGSFWASLKVIIDAVLEQADGNYVLMRDPNEPKLHIYATQGAPAKE
jgi:translation initiation factor 3 subunit D